MDNLIRLEHFLFPEVSESFQFFPEEKQIFYEDYLPPVEDSYDEETNP